MKTSFTASTLGVALTAAYSVYGIPSNQHSSVTSKIPSSQWAELNKTVGGRLFKGEPFAKPCYAESEGEGGPIDAEECEIRKSRVTDERYRLDVFGSAMSTEWESCPTEDSYCRIDAIHPNNTAPFSGKCGQGSVAPYYIDVRQPSDVAVGFEFSRKTGVPISIKNTGHDFAGKSFVKGSLALWTHNLQSISRAKRFIADECDDGTTTDAVTLGAGVHWEQAYKWAEAEHVTVLGGACPTVGSAGGWVQGGGHGALSNVYGLGVDRVLQFKVVTPDGKLRTANKCQNSDLFWALRGGGGGTWGVALETTYKLEPQLTLQVYNISFKAHATPERIRAFTKTVIDNSISLAEASWGGYIEPYGIHFLNPKLGLTQARETMKPVIDFVASLGDIVQDGINDVITMNSYYEFQNDVVLSTTEGLTGYVGSIFGRFVHKANFDTESDRAALLEAMLEVYARSYAVLVLAVAPYSYKGDHDATSVHPGWRSAVWHVAGISLKWDWDIDATGLRAKFEEEHQISNVLKAITPFDDAGGYLSETDLLEPDWEKTLFGSNYPRLLQIKKKYDPEGLLDCWHCVGWSGHADPRFQCYV